MVETFESTRILEEHLVLNVEPHASSTVVALVNVV